MTDAATSDPRGNLEGAVSQQSSRSPKAANGSPGASAVPARPEAPASPAPEAILREMGELRDYAEGLERRIAEQWDQIKSLTEEREKGNKKARKKIVQLEVMVGKRELRIERLLEAVSYIKPRMDAYFHALSEIASMAGPGESGTGAGGWIKTLTAPAIAQAALTVVAHAATDDESPTDRAKPEGVATPNGSSGGPAETAAETE